MWYEKYLLIAWCIPISLLIIIVLEYVGTTSFATYQTPFSSDTFAQILGAGGSLLLSFLLVILYHKQAKMHRQSHEPHLVGEIESKEVVSSVFLIKNTGDGYAYDVSAEWTVDGRTREWKISSLAPGEQSEFPVLVDEDDNWILNTNLIEKKLNDGNHDTIIEWNTTCKNQFGRTMKNDGSVDFLIQSKRSEASEIWQKEPIDEIRKSIDNIEGDFKKIRRDTRKRRRETKWETRSKKSLLIGQIIDEYGSMDIEELSYLTGIKESSLEYRLSGLEDVGAIEFNETTGKIRPKRPAASNHSLDDFL